MWPEAGRGLKGRSVADLPEELRRFLLVPKPNGGSPPRLRDLTCLFYSVVLQESPRDTQQALFSLSEALQSLDELAEFCAVNASITVEIHRRHCCL